MASVFKELYRVLADDGQLRIIETYTPSVAHEWFEKYGDDVLKKYFVQTNVLTSRMVKVDPQLVDQDRHDLEFGIQPFDERYSDRFANTIWDFKKIS